MWQEYFRNEVFMSARWNAEAKEPNAHHKTEYLNNDDDASLCGHMKASTTIGTEAKIVKQILSWRPVGITWVRVAPSAAALTPNTAATASDETSWDRAKARSFAGSIANCLMLNRHDIAYDIEEVIERIGQMP